jgi:hypothetical protein
LRILSVSIEPLPPRRLSGPPNLAADLPPIRAAVGEALLGHGQDDERSAETPTRPIRKYTGRQSCHERAGRALAISRRMSRTCVEVSAGACGGGSPRTGRTSLYSATAARPTGRVSAGIVLHGTDLAPSGVAVRCRLPARTLGRR